MINDPLTLRRPQATTRAERRGLMREALHRLRAGFKALSTRMTFAGRVTWAFLPRTRYNYAAAVDPLSNSIVGSVVDWIARNFPEAPFQVLKASETQWEPVLTHPLTLLIERPNPFYSGVLLWMATLVDFVVAGNAYWRKIRSGAGKPVQLWWIPSSLIEPRFPHDGSEYITHYEYNTGLMAPERLDVADIVHFRWGLDPGNVRKGLSPVSSLFREIFTDDEAANYTAALLKNLGVPGIIISPDSDDVEVSQEDADDIRDDFKQRFGGDGRGEPMVMSGKSKVSMISFSPEQMNLKDLRRVPEERVSARLGIPAIVAGLGAGLDRSTFANFAEARQSAYENGIIPIQRLLLADLDVQLLPDFEGGRNFRCGFDLTQVRVLQDDQTALFARMDVAIKGGWAMVGEGRRAVGLTAGPEHDYFIRSISVEEVPASAQIRAPEAPGAPLPSPTPIRAVQEAASRKARGEQVRVARERAITRSAKRVATDLDALAEVAATRVSKAKGDPFVASDFADLMQTLRSIHLESVIRATATAAEQVDGTPLELDDPATTNLLRDLGKRIVGITETTRASVARAVTRAQEAGTPATVLADEIRNLGAFSESRAHTIARTELTTAENLSAIETWKATGFVEEVDILDGDGCGWTHHDDPDLAHGTRRTLKDFEENTTAHPNCVRVGVPVVTKSRTMPVLNGHIHSGE